MQALDTLFSPQGLQSRFATPLLNRYSTEKEGKKHWFITRLSGNTTWNIPGTNDVLYLWAGGHYHRDVSNALTATHRAYGPKSALVGTGERISQREELTSRNYDYNAGARYTYTIQPYLTSKALMMSVMPELSYSRYHHDQDNSHWQLREQLSGAALGVIMPPSAISPQRLAIDLNNSIHSRYVSDTYAPTLRVEAAYYPPNTCP